MKPLTAILALIGLAAPAIAIFTESHFLRILFIIVTAVLSFIAGIHVAANLLDDEPTHR